MIIKKFKKNSNVILFIPTYNEKENIENLIREIFSLYDNFDILVLDDNSPDGTKDVVKKLIKTFKNLNLIVRDNKLGIGSAHKQGLVFAKKQQYKLLITMDADYTHQPLEIKLLINKIYSGDIVIGTRFINKDSLRDWSLYRIFLTKLGHILTKVLLRIPYDSTGAFRVYKLQKIPYDIIEIISSNNYDFFYESLKIFDLAKLKIIEVPIKLNYRTLGSSKMEFKHIIDGLINLFLLSFKIRKIKYEILKLQKKLPL